MNVGGASQGSAIGDASSWLTSMLTGSVAISFAVLAVAGVGYSLLTGRLQVRRGVTVVLGCFVLFGASTVAKSLLGVSEVQPTALPQQTEAEIFLPPTQPQQRPTQKQQSPFDPYAGAALPQQ